MARNGVPLPSSGLYIRRLYKGKILNGTADDPIRIFQTACKLEEAACEVLKDPVYTARLSPKQLAYIIICQEDGFITESLVDALLGNLGGDHGEKKFIDVLVALLAYRYEGVDIAIGHNIFALLVKSSQFKQRIIDHGSAAYLLQIKFFLKKYPTLVRAIRKKQEQHCCIGRAGEGDYKSSGINTFVRGVKYLNQVAVSTTIHDLITFTEELKDRGSTLYLWKQHFLNRFGVKDPQDAADAVIDYFKTNKQDLAAIMMCPKILVAIRRLYPIVDSGELPALLADCYPRVNGKVILNVLQELKLTVDQEYAFLLQVKEKPNGLLFVCKFIPELLQRLDRNDIIELVASLRKDLHSGELLRTFLSYVVNNQVSFSSFHGFIFAKLDDRFQQNLQASLVETMGDLFVTLLLNYPVEFIEENEAQIRCWLRGNTSLAKMIAQSDARLQVLQESFFSECINVLELDDPDLESRACMQTYIVSYIMKNALDRLDENWGLLLDIALEHGGLAYNLFCINNKDNNAPEVAYNKLLSDETDPMTRDLIIDQLWQEYPQNPRVCEARSLKNQSSQPFDKVHIPVFN